MLILGIESSCDETAAALVEVAADGTGRVVNSTVYTQHKEHLDYGGVVPEIAARAHVDKMDPIIRTCLQDAGCALDDIDGIAATAGPGLLGGLLVGVSYAKSLALATGKPFLGVNHLEGHALTCRLTDNTPFPYLLLLVSGGHCQFILTRGVGDYTTLGGTLDDAVGEAFDKVAKLLGLGYPGGPRIEALAKEGDPTAFKLPLPLRDKGIDFSFSGLKTAARQLIQAQPKLDTTTMANICASFQEAVAQILEIKTRRALKQCGAKHFVLAGGVAANTLLRQRLEAVCTKLGVTFAAPPLAFCTDNAAMIAYAGGLRLLAGEVTDLELNATPRWPLDTLTPPQQGLA